MKNTIRILSLVMALLMVAVLCIGCAKKPAKTEDDRALVIQESTFDGVFSPFFASNAYDVDVESMINAALLATDITGAAVAGNDLPTVALSYEIYYADANGNRKADQTYEEGDLVKYEFVLKNGMKFSDGTALTAEDVLFNMYVYLDPAYDGSSTLYTIPIQGYMDYKLQVKDSATSLAEALAIFKKGEAAANGDKETYYWNTAMTEAGAKFAQSIVDYVLVNYCKEEYISDPITGYVNGYTPEQIKASKALTVAFGMQMWGFGNFTYEYSADANGGYVGVKNEDGTYSPKAKLATALMNATYADFTAAADGKYVKVVTKDDQGNDVVSYKAYKDGMEGERYNSTLKSEYTVLNRKATGFKDALGKTYALNSAELTAANYYSVMKAAYENDYATLNETEQADVDLVSTANQIWAQHYGQSGKVDSISGITSGKKTVDGKEHETVTITLTEQNPKAILSLGVTIAPKAYYTKGYTYAADAVVVHGVEFNSTKFMDQLKKFNGAPVGAGPYKMSQGPHGSFYEDNVVYFERNEYFETMGGDNIYNTNIKYMHMVVVTSGAEYDALKSGTCMYATVSASTDVMNSLNDDKNLTGILVDNLGYGYIVINPEVYKNVNTRIALNTVFNLSKVNDYYPNGLAEVIYRCQTTVSWAYPEGAKPIYAYDATGAVAKKYFEEAGYTFSNGQMIDPETGAQAEFTFYLPSDAASHPAGGIFIDARDILNKLGAKAEIKVDTNLIANIKAAPVGIYALAWTSTPDPDMYQVYHYASQATSVVSNGIKGLYSGTFNTNEYGTIEVTKLNGDKVTMNQKEALAYLGELIEQGTKYMTTAERKPIYNCALNLLSQLAIEVPTYQRKNLFVYDNTVIDGSSLASKTSPYWGPMAEIWKVSFVASK